MASEKPTLSDDEIGAAIARLTRALVTADDDGIAPIVAERKALRLELEERKRERVPDNVLSLEMRRRGQP